MDANSGTSTLSPELISLIHHIELNSSGWWEKTIKRLVIAAIWLDESPLELSEIHEVLKTTFHVNIAANRIQALIDELAQENSLVALPNHKYKISEARRKELTVELLEAEEVDAQAKKLFGDALNECCDQVDVDEGWRAFNELFFIPLVREMGARIFELLSTKVVDFDKSPHFLKYIGSYDDHTSKNLRLAVINFFNPQNQIIRSYVMQRLNTYFFLQASNLDEKTIAALSKSQDKPPTFKVLLDTNFLFSILGIHENPANDAAKALIDLAKVLRPKLDISLLVLPATVEEAKRVLAAIRNDIRNLRLTSNVYEAVKHGELGGVAQRYVEEYTKSGSTLSVDDYFSPYVDDLATMLSAKGVEVEDVDLTGYATKSEVVSNILEQQEFEKRRPPRKGHAKEYEQLEHDMVLWQYAKDRRPAYVESPIAASYWVITVDYRFLGFDASNRRRTPARVPICLHPTTLIQMLQFWVSRDDKVDEVMIDTIRLPLLFQEFDADTERATVKIISSLSTYENLEDAPTETIKALLVNKLLRRRLVESTSVNEEKTLVHEALIEENRNARKEIDRISKLKQEDRENHDLTVDKLGSEIKTLGATLREETEAKQEAEKQIDEMAARLTGLEQLELERVVRKADARFVLLRILLPILLLLAVGLLAGILVRGAIAQVYVAWLVSIAIWIVLGLSGLYFVIKAADRAPDLAQSRFMASVQNLRRHNVFWIVLLQTIFLLLNGLVSWIVQMALLPNGHIK